MRRRMAWLAGSHHMGNLYGITTTIFLSLFFNANTVRAEVVVNSPSNSSSGATNVSGSGYNGLAIKFNATLAFAAFSEIKLNLFRNTASPTGTYTITLYSNNPAGNSTPSTLLDTIGTGNWSATATTKDSFVTFSNVSLGASRTAGAYWLVVTSTNTNTSDYQWARSATSPGSSLTAANLTPGGWTNLTNNEYYGAVITTATSVPEPGTLLLGGIAAACGGGGVWWKRRRRPGVETKTEESPAN